MHVATVAGLVGVVSMACVGPEPSRPTPLSATGPSSVDAFRFAWPRAARARVTDTAVEDGVRIVMAYDVVVEPSAGELHVRLEGFEYVHVDGMELTEPEVRAQLEPLLAMAAAIPVLRIAADGRVQGVIGLERAIDRTLQTLKALEEWSDEDPDWLAASARLRSATGRAEIACKAEELWRVWVGQWVGLALGPGQSRTETIRLPVGDGRVVTAPVVLTNRGPASAGPPPTVTLTARVVLDGEGTRNAIERALDSTSPDQEPVLQSVRRDIGITAETDPQTLMPRRVSKQVIVRIQTSAGEAERVTRRAYAFDWRAAASPGVP